MSEQNDSKKTHDGTRTSPCSVSIPPKTKQRLGYLDDPQTLDELLDAFQDDGMPMGSKRWATHCLCRLRELKAHERALRRLTHKLKDAVDGYHQDETMSDLWIDKRRCLTREHQRDQDEQNTD